MKKAKRKTKKQIKKSKERNILMSKIVILLAIPLLIGLVLINNTEVTINNTGYGGDGISFDNPKGDSNIFSNMGNGEPLLGPTDSPTPVSLSDQGTGAVTSGTGVPIVEEDLTVEIWDDPTSTNPVNLIYEETFIDAIVEGSWNVMLGEDPGNTLDLQYGQTYYKDYIIGTERAEFKDYQNNIVERQYFVSPLGTIAGEDISGTTDITTTGTGSFGSITTSGIGSFGQIGIGTSNPGVVDLKIEGAIGPGIIIEDTTNPTQALMQAVDNFVIFGSSTNHDVSFVVDSAQKMRITNTGTIVLNDYTTCATLKTDASGTLICETAGAAGAPVGVNYLVGTADAALTNEIVVGTTPNGDLGGTWAAITVDDYSHKHEFLNIDIMSSMQWASRINDETGTINPGYMVFSNTPSINNPVLLGTTQADTIFQGNYEEHRFGQIASAPGAKIYWNPVGDGELVIEVI